MQLFIPAPANNFKPGWLVALRQVAFGRTAIGFTIGEALLWFGFVVMWPIILGGIYFFGGMFDNGFIMSADKYIVTSLVVACTKALLVIPFWWLVFRRLQKLAGWKRMLLHLPLGAIYSALVVFTIYEVKTKTMSQDYPSDRIMLDWYNVLTSYFMNFMLFHAYNFWLASQRQHKKEQELRELAFQSEINALKTQIEPHFLFNTLNSISATVPPSLENTRVLIAQLADTFRYALRVSESQFVSLGDELEFLKTWLALEQHRFGKRLSVHFDIDPHCLYTSVPPMLLQPLVENALNHGIAHRVEGGTVTIRCRVQAGGSVSIAVQDTGVGYAGDLDQLMHKGVGLTNTAKRLQLLYNQTVSIERMPQGLSFSFQLPLNSVHETERIDH